MVPGEAKHCKFYDAHSVSSRKKCAKNAKLVTETTTTHDVKKNRLTDRLRQNDINCTNMLAENEYLDEFDKGEIKK